MKIRIQVFPFLFLLFIFQPSHGMARKEKPHFPEIRGMALSIYVHQKESEIEQALEEIAELGANTVLIKVSEVQEVLESNVIRPDTAKTLPLQKLRFVIEEARSRGFRVLLMPIVLINNPRNRKEWRGKIRPKSLDLWFDSYRDMILKYARVARDGDIDLFSLGSELVSMEKYESRWSSLIKEIREIYQGSLLYSANWDHLSTSSAWRNLDFVGLTGYFELADREENPDLKELRRRWGEILPSVEAWSRSLGKKMILTEIGYPSRVGALWDPWDHTRSAQPNEVLQEKAIQSVIDAWVHSPRLEGILFYEWYGSGGQKDGGYTPKGKKAETVLRRFFHPY